MPMTLLSAFKLFFNRYTDNTIFCWF